jgi:UDP-3-O-[3-hydroxymyristoyl] glucosamine N-acyltransferase
MMVTLNTGVIGKKCMIYSNCGIVTDPLIGNYIYIYIVFGFRGVLFMMVG